MLHRADSRYGWVPVYAADVRKAMLTENLNLKDAKTAEYSIVYTAK